MAKVERILRLSEKGRKSLQCSLTEHRNGSFRPILASLRFPNLRSEYRSYPFSDSLRRGILGSWTSLYEVLGSSKSWGVRSMLRKRTGGAQREHAEFSRWAGAKHQNRHDEGRARRHVVLGGRHRGAADIPRRRGQIRVS